MFSHDSNPPVMEFTSPDNIHVHLPGRLHVLLSTQAARYPVCRMQHRGNAASCRPRTSIITSGACS